MHIMFKHMQSYVYTAYYMYVSYAYIYTYNCYMFRLNTFYRKVANRKLRWRPDVLATDIKHMHTNMVFLCDNTGPSLGVHTFQESHMQQ